MTKETGRIWSRHPSECGSVMTYTESDGTIRHLFVFDSKYRKLLPFHKRWTPNKVTINDWVSSTVSVNWADVLTDEDINSLSYIDTNTTLDNKNKVIWTTPETYSPAMYYVDSISVEIDGEEYKASIPTIQQLIRIFADRDIISDLENSGRSNLLYSYFASSSTYHSNRYIWAVGYNGQVTPQNLEYSETYIIPVFELPEYTHPKDSNRVFESTYSTYLETVNPFPEDFNAIEIGKYLTDYSNKEKSVYKTSYDGVLNSYFFNEYSSIATTTFTNSYTGIENTEFRNDYTHSYVAGVDVDYTTAMSTLDSVDTHYTGIEKSYWYDTDYTHTYVSEVPTHYYAIETNYGYETQYTGIEKSGWKNTDYTHTYVTPLPTHYSSIENAGFITQYINKESSLWYSTDYSHTYKKHIVINYSAIEENYNCETYYTGIERGKIESPEYTFQYITSFSPSYFAEETETEYTDSYKAEEGGIFEVGYSETVIEV